MMDYYDVYTALLEKGVDFSVAELETSDNYMPVFDKFMDRLYMGLKKIRKSDNHLIPLYFIDEFSYLYEWIEKGALDGKTFMRFWKSFIQDYSVCAIIIAQDNVPIWRAKFENEFACMNNDNEITFLDYKGAEELICEPCRKNNQPLFNDEAVKLIYDWTSGSAYLIVIFCKYIVDYLNANYMEKATKTIVQLVFEREFLEDKGMFESQDFEPQIQDVANVGDEGEKINNLNLLLLTQIAAATIASIQVKKEELAFFNQVETSLAERVFQRLKERKIIEVERENYCSIRMPLLKFYLLREKSLFTKEVFTKLTRK